jgi:hypothetical protein
MYDIVNDNIVNTRNPYIIFKLSDCVINNAQPINNMTPAAIPGATILGSALRTLRLLSLPPPSV